MNMIGSKSPDVYFVDAAEIQPLTLAEVVTLERAELGHFVTLLRLMPVEAWRMPTRSPGRDIHSLAAHVAGTYAAQASLRQLGRQIDPRVHHFYRSPGQRIPETITRLQIDDRMNRSSDQIIDEIDSSGERAIRFRSLLLRPLQRVSLEQISRHRWIRRGLSPREHLYDLWLHRLDLCVSANLPFVVEENHDRRMFEGKLGQVAELIGQQLDSKRVDLSITGIASAHYRFGESDQPSGTIDIASITLAILIAGWHSPAAARERSEIQGDVKTVMTLLSAIS